MGGNQLYLFGLKQNEAKPIPKQGAKLPLDILTIIAVVFILSLIISFSLGVEKGKKIALSKQKPEVAQTSRDFNLAAEPPATA